MHRAFVDHINSDFSLDSQTLHRFVKVLRLKNEELVELFDGQGNLLRGSFNQAEPTVLANAQLTQVQPDAMHICLIQALVPMEKLEYITQHATELGVNEIVLFKSERSQVDFKDKMPAKLERLTRIAQDAARQCGRAFVPVVTSPPNPLSSTWRGETERDLLLLPSPGTGEGLGERSPKEGRVSIIIGPEGGLSPAENERFISLGAKPIRLAKYVLRTETAGLTALAQIQGSLL
ncbi:MAG: RsmE family RNA methyltransferase [Myxococcota bacterium]